MSLYPINLKIGGKLCVIVGGGVVANRKATGLIEAGAHVRVISPELVGGLQGLARQKKLEWFSRTFAEGDLEGAFLVFAATNNSGVQAQIHHEAEKNRVLLNSADDPVGSNFHVPAHFRRGKMLLSIATGGGSPALAKELREKLEEVLVPEYALVVELLSIIREKIVTSGDNQQVHAELFRSLLKNGIVDLVLSANWFDVQMLLLEELPDHVDGVTLLKKFLEKHDRV